MLPDRVSNPGPLTYESGALPIALRGPAIRLGSLIIDFKQLQLNFNGSNTFWTMKISSRQG